MSCTTSIIFRDHSIST